MRRFRSVPRWKLRAREDVFTSDSNCKEVNVIVSRPWLIFAKDRANCMVHSPPSSGEMAAK